VMTRTDLRPAATLVAVLLVAVGVLGLALRLGPTPAFDTSLSATIMASFPQAVTQLFDTLGALPVFAGVMLGGAVVAFAVGRPAMSGAFLLGLASEIATTAIKLAVDRPRPPAGAGIDAFVTSASYPSGHTVRAVLMGGLIVAAFAWTGRGRAIRFVAVLAGVAFAAIMGLARIASGEHWPTDVIGGWLLGVAWLTISLLVADRFERQRGRPPPAAG
jgi:membrane-associated phospholipid phosphatase